MTWVVQIMLCEMSSSQRAVDWGLGGWGLTVSAAEEVHHRIMCSSSHFKQLGELPRTHSLISTLAAGQLCSLVWTISAHKGAQQRTSFQKYTSKH